MTHLRWMLGAAIVLLGCESASGPPRREPARTPAPPVAMVVRATGEVPADLAASKRTAERWIGLWEQLATIAEATPDQCDQVGAAWAAHLAQQDGLAAMLAASSAEPEPMRKRIAARYRQRLNRLMPRIDRVRTACAGNAAVDASLASLSPAAGADPHQH